MNGNYKEDIISKSDWREHILATNQEKGHVYCVRRDSPTDGKLNSFRIQTVNTLRPDSCFSPQKTAYRSPWRPFIKHLATRVP